MRSRCSSTRPSEHISRCATSSFDISSVNTATGIPWWSARFEATPRANADLPMLGRPATTTRLPGWRPEVSESRSRKPVGVPGHLAARLVHLRDLLEALADEDLDVLEAAADPVLGEIEDHLLGAVDELRGLAGAIPAEPLDVSRRRRSARAASPSRARSARGGRRSRSPGRASRSPGSRSLPPISSSSPFSSSLSATVIASTGMPVLEQVERRAVDLRVRLAVEVAARR